MTVAAPAVWPRLEDVVDPIRTIVDGTDQITCLAHKDADADSLGSALGVRARAPRVGAARFASSSPSRCRGSSSTFPGFETVETGGAPLGDTVFTFDCATLGRFGERRDEVERAAHGRQHRPPPRATPRSARSTSSTRRRARPAR